VEKLLLACTLSLASAGAAAFGWPWQSAPEERLAYCKGFVTGGLTARGPQGTDRTELWLAWRTLIREGAADHRADQADYDTGRARFDGLASHADEVALLEEMRGECALSHWGYRFIGW